MLRKSLEDLLPNGPKYEIDETYLTLVKWLMASAHCSKLGASLSLTPSDPVNETKAKLVGSNTSDLGVGVSEDPGPSSSTVPQFSSLKGKPVGSQESILFWNKDQAQFLFQDNPRCIIKGDYGSGKTLVLFAKLKSLVEKKRKVVFISCLLPYADVPPIYESIMRKKLKELGDNIRFYSAMGICSEMGVRLGNTDREKSFYSVLAKFIQNLPEEFIFLDEFGETLDSKDKEDLLGVTGYMAGIEGKHLIISLHPRCNIDVSKLKDQGYEISELKYIMRNTASIWKYDKSVSGSASDSLSSTVLGLQPVYIVGSEDMDFYSRTVEEVCKKRKKFVCFIPDRYIYDDNQFKAELGRRGIETFEYLKVGDEENLDTFLESQEGCLITRYQHARGTECTTLLVFERNDMEPRLLRGTTHLVFADLDRDNNPVSVEEPEPGYILIQGNKHDPVVYSSLVDKMLEKKVERYIVIYEYSFVQLFLIELERRGLPTPVKIPRAMYSVEDITTHLQENRSGGIMYQRWGIEDCLEWIGANSKIPIIYIDDRDFVEDVKRIREGNPTLFIRVNVQ
ncbi:uncharacterized protein LOC111714558 [Eurytemora carolleeae]|uniref:uncharacterized protein LOC111714558 n=1 Tax=Eurytemora carolleeae TaxID=1294199 RepID=UPI000C776F61|nr:uncharacterized protein LOC111714558 [Eurytemora carolleeae]|eukprot:XP_023345460.1 uncharacterized protein LOC111714558 [Eurytemora affinis]